MGEGRAGPLLPPTHPALQDPASRAAHGPGPLHRAGPDRVLARDQGKGADRLSRELSVAVLGAGGTIAPALVRDLAESDEVSVLGPLGMGSSPGKTNVMAVQAVRALGSDPRELRVIAAGRDLSPPRGGTSFPYAVQTLVDEVTLPPVVLEGGEPIEIEPLSSGGE